LELLEALQTLDFANLDLVGTDVVTGAYVLLRIYDSVEDDHKIIPVWTDTLDGFSRLGMLTAAVHLAKQGIGVWDED
jgi:hypothetical protein